MNQNISCVKNIQKWIDGNKEEFKPPVCNKCMFDEQLMVFFIGGPNVRKDYHIDLSEEVFYQLKGNMCLKVLEQSQFKDIEIKEGEIFMLPSCIPHSPQRYKNTMGMVIERKRQPHEKDGLRYYVQNGSQDILYERWAYIGDIREDLPPIIRGFFNSEACRLGLPTTESVLEPAPVNVDSKTELIQPFDLNQWINGNLEEIRSERGKVMFGPPDFTTTVKLFAKGTHTLDPSNMNISIHQLRGTSLLENDARLLNNGEIAMKPMDERIGMDYFITSFRWTIHIENDDSVVMTVQMEPPK